MTLTMHLVRLDIVEEAFPELSSSSSLPRSLHSGAQRQSVGAAVRPIALIKSSTITGSLFKEPVLCQPKLYIVFTTP